MPVNAARNLLPDALAFVPVADSPIDDAMAQVEATETESVQVRDTLTETETSSGPGFGAVAALGSLGVGGWLAKRR